MENDKLVERVLMEEFNEGFRNLRPGTQFDIDGETYILIKETSLTPTCQNLFRVDAGTIHHSIEFFSPWLGFEQVRQCIIRK